MVKVKKAQAQRRVWVVFAGLCIYYFVAFGLIYNGLGMFLTPISEDTGIPFTQVSLTSSVRILVGMVTTAVGGRVFPRVKMPWFLSGNILLLATACMIMAHAQILPQLLAGSVLMGFAAGFALYSLVPIILNQWFAKPEKYVSIATAAGGAGGILFCPLLTMAIEMFGWRTAYQSIGFIVLAVMLPLALLVIRYSPKEYGLEPYRSRGEKKKSVLSNEIVLPKGKVQIYMIICLALFFVLASVLSGMYGHIASAFWSKGFANREVGLLSAAYQLGATSMQFLFGIMCVRIGLKRSLDFMMPLILAACVGLVLTGSHMLIPTVWWAVLLGVGRSFGTVNPIITRYIFGSERMTGIYSVLYALFLAGTAATAVIFGAIYHKTGTYDLVYILVGACALAELFLVQMIFGILQRGGFVPANGKR